MVGSRTVSDPGNDASGRPARSEKAYSADACTVYEEIEAIVRTSGADELREIGERMEGAGESSPDISSATGLSKNAADLLLGLEDGEKMAAAFLIGAFLQDHHPDLFVEAMEHGGVARGPGGRDETGMDNPLMMMALGGAREAYQESCAAGAASAEARQDGDQGSAGEAGGAELSKAELEALVSSIRACWNIDPGSPAASVSMTIEFSLDRAGRVEPGSIRQASAEGPAEAHQDAFERARRAILRCERGGYDLPEDKYEQWRTMMMPFDPAGL